VNRFCRHNRFIERCPICRETVPGLAPPERPGRARSRSKEGSAQRAHASGRRASPRRGRGPELRLRQETRAEDDGYRSSLLPGLRASQDAERLAEEIAFADGRLVAITMAPPDLYGEVREQEDEEQATWMCFVAAYLSPLEDDDPFAGVRRALETDWRAGELPDLSEIPLGPRTSHDPARGDATLRAYLQWAQHAGGPEHAGSPEGAQRAAFVGDGTWTAQRRFDRLFERLRLPGFARMGRYDLLVTLGRIGLYELRTDSLYLGAARAGEPQDLTTVAAKRLFGIGEPMHLERRAQLLAEAISVPVEALDLAFANWGAGERATLGSSPEVLDRHALERAREALEL
jgi:hypothetical protein